MERYDYPIENGLTYNMDLREDSYAYSVTAPREAAGLPVCPVGYGYYIAGPRFDTLSRGRYLYQVFVTYRGAGRFNIDGREFMVGPDTVIFLNLVAPHSYKTEGEIWEHEYVNFSGSACAAYDKLINREGMRVFSIRNHPGIVRQMQKIRAHAAQDNLRSFVHCSTQIIALLDEIFDLAVQQDQLSREEKGNIMRSVEYIDSHYMDRFTLEDLANAAYLSKYYYARAFKRYVGMTPFEYVNSVRVRQAKQLLMTTSETVETISGMVGCGASQNLNRLFKRVIGTTPAKYRQGCR